MIPALYIDPKGPYPALSVDSWDAARDARLYEGPHPVVAHPPCKHWSRLRHMAHVAKCTGCGRGFTSRQYSFFEEWQCADCGALVRGTSDADCAPRAVEQVRRWGGVLEHPAQSKLWEHCDLPEPDLVWPGLPCARISTASDSFGGYTIELDQVEWGHCCRKRTWLYLVGVPRSALEAPPFPGRKWTHQVSRDVAKAHRNGYTLKRASAAQGNQTPPLFAEYLIRLARTAVRL